MQHAVLFGSQLQRSIPLSILPPDGQLAEQVPFQQSPDGALQRFDLAHSSRDRNLPRVILGDFSAYYDCHRDTLVMLRLPSVVHGANSIANAITAINTSKRDTFTVMDTQTGKCLARDIVVKTRCEAFCYEPCASVVWAFSSTSGKLDRWVCQPLQPKGIALPSEASAVHPWTAALAILQEISSYAVTSALWSPGIQATLNVLKTALNLRSPSESNDHNLELVRDQLISSLLKSFWSTVAKFAG